MADGYLESRYAEYEKRKAQWQKKKNKFSVAYKNRQNQVSAKQPKKPL